MDADSMQAEIASLKTNVDQLWQLVRDHEQRFDTLQTPLWKRVWFRIDGWPGQCDLNASGRAWRPWHRRT
jgi:hypothetical protein